MLNKAMIIGRLGRDPELRYTQSGVPVTTLNVATSETYTDRDGNRNEVTEWHRVSVFQRQAENCVRYLRKGSLVFVEGNLQTRKWQDQQGMDRYTTVIRAQRVTFLDRRNDGPREEYDSFQQDGQAQGQFQPRTEQHGYQDASPSRRPFASQQPQTGDQSTRDDAPVFPSEIDAPGPSEKNSDHSFM
ncbi:MAG: single-stranded DNA-binding protein [Desulfovibrio sp.]|nr:single-stranded DNA-binding protein [Desulfovibrio sp.]